MNPGPAPTTWRWAYVAFRFGDGASHALVALAVVMHYGLPVWMLAVTTACMNLVGVPASFLWGSVVDRATHRRRIVVLGFAMAAAAMALMAAFPPFPFYVAGAMLYTMFGVATSPAASILALQGVPQARWAHATSALSRSTGLAFLSGMVGSIILGFAFPDPPFEALFAGCAVMAAGAAFIAWRTITPGLPRLATPYDPGVVAAGSRLFERAVYFPSRLRNSPNLASLRDGLRRHPLWPLGTILTFTGSVSFFTGYTGVLANDLALSAGMVLLCSAPSHIVTPFAYPWAARQGIRSGKSRTVARGAILRLLGVPGLCLSILLLGAKAVPLLLVFHALMGFSFSLMQVNAPLLLAEIHPGGKGQGVGLHHASLGAGTLAGSVSAFLLLRAFDGLWANYVFSITLTVIGVACLTVAHRRHELANPPPARPAMPGLLPEPHES